MELSERLGWLILGMAIGFVLGFIVARLRSIEEKVEIVDEHVTKNRRREHNDAGFMRFPVVADVLYFLVLVVVLWGVVTAQRASNEVEGAQNRIEQVTECNRSYLASLLRAVEPRTDASQEQDAANMELQRAWYRFVKFQLHLPPYPEDEQREKANLYAERLKQFLDAAKEAQIKSEENPYPTAEALSACISKEIDR